MSENEAIINDPEDAPVSQVTYTKSGQEIDLNNIPGAKKLELIEKGELKIDSFISPANMPGVKLKALRDEHRERVMESLTRRKMNGMKIGVKVLYKEEEYSITRTIPEESKVVIRKADAKKEDKSLKVPVTLVALVPVEE